MILKFYIRLQQLFYINFVPSKIYFTAVSALILFGSTFWIDFFPLFQSIIII